MDTDAFAAAMLTYRNTPCRFLGVSPAQILFARKLRDGVCVAPEQLKLRAEWVLTAEQREQALAKRHAAGEEFWSRASKEKGEFTLGSTVIVKRQRGPTKGKLETSGTVDLKGSASGGVRIHRASRPCAVSREPLDGPDPRPGG